MKYWPLFQCFRAMEQIFIFNVFEIGKKRRIFIWPNAVSPTIGRRRRHSTASNQVDVSTNRIGATEESSPIFVSVFAIQFSIGY